MFKAEHARTFNEKLAIDISQRDFADAPAGIPYDLSGKTGCTVGRNGMHGSTSNGFRTASSCAPEHSPRHPPLSLAGESCIPGMDASNVESMFEEHTISGSLDPFSTVNNEFGLRERVFNFGSVVADLVSGAEAAAAQASSGGGGGVRANLKVINPIKVPCTINFSMKPRGQYPPGEATARSQRGVILRISTSSCRFKPHFYRVLSRQSLGVPFPMECDPPQIVIPPMEFRYVAVVFRPRAIQQFSATFDAVVVDGSDPATKGFSCEMRGEGTLPSLSLQEPSVFDAGGRPLLRFGRQLLGRSQRLRVNLKNNGIMPAGARLEFEPNEHFSVLEGPQVFSVDSKRSQTFTVEFRPLGTGQFQHEARIRVQNNPFEDYCVAMTGEGYQEDVTFDQLPDNAVDELRLPDCPVGKPHRYITGGPSQGR